MNRILIIMAVCLSAITLQAQQKGYYLQKDGLKFTVEGKNGKGDHAGKVETSFFKGGYATLNSFDKKDKIETKKPFEATLEYKDGKPLNADMLQITQISAQVLCQELLGEHEISNYEITFEFEGEPWVIPSDVEIGASLPNYTIRYFGRGMNFITIAVTDAKVSGRETIEIGGEKIECLIIDSKRDYNFLIERVLLTSKEWYGFDYGALHIETVDKKGKPSYSAHTIAIDKL